MHTQTHNTRTRVHTHTHTDVYKRQVLYTAVVYKTTFISVVKKFGPQECGA